MADKIIRFIKEWFLVIGMTVGVLAYLAYDALPSIHAYGPVLHRVCKIVQPLLLFVMLLKQRESPASDPEQTQLSSKAARFFPKTL